MSATLRPTALLTLLALAAPAAAETLKVPAQFSTIGEAVAAAADGDTISIAKGTYLEQVIVSTPNLKISGKGAVIDAEFQGICIEIGADGVSVSGMTCVNGTAGIFASGTGFTFSKCSAYTCALEGFALEGGGSTITGCTAVGCGGAGIAVTQLSPDPVVLEKNTCERNGGNGIQVVGGVFTLAKNRCEGNAGNGLLLDIADVAADGPPSIEKPVLVQKNTCVRNEDAGLRLLKSNQDQAVIEKNDFSQNAGRGIEADAVAVTITKNTCDGNLAAGMNLLVSGGFIEKNSASGNLDDGIVVDSFFDLGDGGGFGTGDNNELEGNTCKDNGRDGIVLFSGQNNRVEDNTCSGNADDGIDVDTAGLDEILLLDNTCSDNGHEGIDNSGEATVIDGNVCKNNGRGIGPDIAGAGDGAEGSVSSFEGNKFGTGGETEASRLDNYAQTGS